MQPFRDAGTHPGVWLALRVWDPKPGHSEGEEVSLSLRDLLTTVTGSSQRPQEGPVAWGRPSQEDQPPRHQVRKSWSWELQALPVGDKLTNPPRSLRSGNLNHAQLGGKSQTAG